MAAPADSPDDRFCRAIDLARFKKALAAATGHAAPGSERWALAVSGGADSMALLRLAAAAAEGARDRLLVLTVDHGLRAAAAAEARQVAAWCAGLGVPHEVLTVRENPPAAGLQAWARRQRYERLLQRCRDENIAHLLLGHQRQDQAETVFHRLRRDSGPAGLAGMAAPTIFRGVRLCRPLLDESRAATEATCRAFDQPWLEDPSNQDKRFQRVRDRRFLAGGDWPTTDHLVRVGRAMATARREIDRWGQRFLADHGVWHAGGWLTLARGPWAGLPATLRLSLVSQAIQAVGGGAYPPARDGLSRVADLMVDGEGALTLGGCRIICQGAGVVICREWQLMAPWADPPAGQWHRWDNRFEVWVPPGLGRLACAPLGEDGWRALDAVADRSFIAALSQAPWPARLAFPVLRHLDDGGLVHQVKRVRERAGFDPHTAALVFMPNGPLFDAQRHGCQLVGTDAGEQYR